MKFLLDVCASSHSLRAMLTDLGYDVISGLEINPRASDEELLGIANQEERVLITEDKDFGELVYLHRLPHSCIIRLVDMRVEEKTVAMQKLIECHSDAMKKGSIIVVSQRRVRIRPGRHQE